jgi:CheY-like chemotaxis protein
VVKEEKKQMKILIADDNSINILILSRMLEILPALTDG